jgi:hypothetical protein
MPAQTEEDWAVIARRMARVPEAYRGYRESLEEGARRGLFAAPRQVSTVVGQLGEWLAGPYFAGFVAAGPEALRGELDAAARAADERGRRDPRLPARHLPPQAEGTPDAVGRERYALAARRWTGSDLGAGDGLEEAYAWGWAEHQRILAEQRAEAEKVVPGATPMEAMRWLDEHGEAVEGVEAIRERLQAMMDEAIDALDGVHFDLAEPVRRVEAMIAPPGSAAAPYYTRPAQDFSRPGRTWLPTLGRERFPLWDLVSTWYHEGVPGHHLQLAQWAYVAGQLSTYQTSLGSVGANVEGWALYAERLMDELGYLTDPAPGWATSTPSRCAPSGWSSTSACTWSCRSRRRRGRAGRAPRRAVDAGARPGLLRRELRPRRRPSSTASWSATSACPGRRSATSSASGPGWPAGRRRGRPGRGLRPQGLAHGRAVAGLARPRRPRRGARPAGLHPRRGGTGTAPLQGPAPSLRVGGGEGSSFGGVGGRWVDRVGVPWPTGSSGRRGAPPARGQQLGVPRRCRRRRCSPGRCRWPRTRPGRPATTGWRSARTARRRSSPRPARPARGPARTRRPAASACGRSPCAPSSHQPNQQSSAWSSSRASTAGQPLGDGAGQVPSAGRRSTAGLVVLAEVVHRPGDRAPLHQRVRGRAVGRGDLGPADVDVVVPA